MNTKSTRKKIKDYWHQGVRKLKHRKGYGVHSPFAFSVITDVIDEKIPYYAYQRMQRMYPSNGPLPFKVATLLLRLANRFRSRRIVEIGCDGGYTLLPLAIVDSRNRLTSLATEHQERLVRQHFSWHQILLKQIDFVRSINELADDDLIDLLVVNGIPAGMSPDEFVQWILAHLQPEGVLFVRGIQPGHQLETYWDAVCESEEMPVTMDLYDYGLSIRRQHFFKQHYLVSF